MVDTRPQSERPKLRSRQSEQESFVEDFKRFRGEYKGLHQRLEACDQLMIVADELRDFLKNTSEITAQQERKKGLADQDRLYVQAKALLKVQNPGLPKERVVDYYKRLIRPVSPTESAVALEETSQESVAQYQAELQTDLPEQFKVTLDSSLPQLQYLLKKLYPGEDEQTLASRENRFLLGVAQYVRLEQGASRRNMAAYGLPTPVGDLRDVLGTPESKNRFVNQFLEYVVKTSPVGAALESQLHGREISMQTLQEIEAELQRDHMVLSSSANVRKAEYKVWVTERAGQQKRVAGSPDDIQDLDDIDNAHRMGNKVAGVILYGPPGTGKTEKVREANARKGFDTHIISMHRHSDFAQLMGEAPVFLEGLDQSASKIQKAEAFQRMLEKSDEQLEKQFGQTSQVYEKLLKLTPNTRVRLESKQLKVPSNEEFGFFIAELRGTATKQLVDLFVSGDEKRDDQAWADGEIQRAIKEGKMALLDEGDKATSTAFDGISAILSKRPGESVTLGGKEVTFPHWFRIDMTVNSTDLAEHIRDRFTPLEINYPSTEDLLWKMGLFLADEMGNTSVDLNTEWQMTLFFTHVVPRIQELYSSERIKHERKLSKDPNAQADMFPLSMRGISTFCRRVASGEPMDRVIEQEILAKGKIANGGTEAHSKIISLVAAFSRLTDRLVIANNDDVSSTGVQRMVDSPLYNTIAAREANGEVAKERTLTQTTLDAEQLTRLKSSESTTRPGEVFRLPSGALIRQELSDGKLTFNYSYQVGQRTVTYYSFEYTTLNEKVAILASDQFGEELVIQGSTGTFRVAPIEAQLMLGGIDDALFDAPGKATVSKDGSTIAGVREVESIRTPQVIVQAKGSTLIQFAVDGYACDARNTIVSDDGSAVVIEATDGRVFLTYPQRELVRTTEPQPIVKLDNWQLEGARGITDWRFAGNLLWSPHTELAYVVN